MPTPSNSFKNGQGKQKARWKLWLLLSDGTTKDFYSFPSYDNRSPERSLEKLLFLAKTTKWTWVLARVYDQKNNALHQQIKPKELGR